MPAGRGRAAAATREDLAAAHGAVLTQAGHENKTYALTGGAAVSFADVTQIISKLSGRDVPLITVSDQEYLDRGMAAGLPDFVAPFLLEWVKGINRGEWDQVTGDLEKLLGRTPTTAEEYYRTVYKASR